TGFFASPTSAVILYVRDLLCCALFELFQNVSRVTCFDAERLPRPPKFFRVLDVPHEVENGLRRLEHVCLYVFSTMTRSGKRLHLYNRTHDNSEDVHLAKNACYRWLRY